MLKHTFYVFLALTFFYLPVSLTAEEFPVATDGFSQNYPMVVFDGEDYFTVYLDRRGGDYSFYSRFISPEGVVSQEQLVVPAHPAMSFMPALAMGTENFLYTWSRQRGIFDYNRDGMARILGLNGAPLSGNIQVNDNLAQHSPAFMRTAFDGEHYLVIWQDGLPTQGARILGQFVCATDYNLVGGNFIIRPEVLEQSHAQIYPDILFDGTNYLIVWDDNRSGERSIYGWFYNTDGEPVGDDFVISDQPQRQLLVRVAYNGEHYLAVWADRRHGSKNGVFGQMFDSSGNTVGADIAISPLQNNEERSWPRVGTNGSQFMVVWEQQNLTKEAAQVARFHDLIRYPSAGIDKEKQTVWYEVHGRIINADGSFYTNEIPVGVNQFHQRDPEVTGHGDQFLVLWQDSRVNNQYSDIYGRFIEAMPPVSLEPPVNLTATFTGETIALQWEPPADKDAELLYYRLYKDEELLADEITETEYMDQDFVQNTTYSYFVTAVYDAGESDPSNTATVDIPTLYISVQFQVGAMAAGSGNLRETDPLEGAQVWLENYGEMVTDHLGFALFEEVGVHQSLQWEVSKEGFFPQEGSVHLTEEDMVVEVVLTRDDTSMPLTGEPVQFSIVPNPADQWIKITSDKKMIRLEVLDMLGQTRIGFDTHSIHDLEINISDLPSGIYFLRAIHDDQTVTTDRFVRR